MRDGRLAHIFDGIVLDTRRSGNDPLPLHLSLGAMGQRLEISL
jgi:hypothetical protein